jgi:hypothetical protein
MPGGHGSGVGWAEAAAGTVGWAAAAGAFACGEPAWEEGLEAASAGLAPARVSATTDSPGTRRAPANVLRDCAGLMDRLCGGARSPSGQVPITARPILKQSAVNRGLILQVRAAPSMRRLHGGPDPGQHGSGARLWPVHNQHEHAALLLDPDVRHRVRLRLP